MLIHTNHFQFRHGFNFMREFRQKVHTVDVEISTKVQNSLTFLSTFLRPYCARKTILSSLHVILLLTPNSMFKNFLKSQIRALFFCKGECQENSIFFHHKSPPPPPRHPPQAELLMNNISIFDATVTMWKRDVERLVPKTHSKKDGYPTHRNLSHPNEKVSS